MALVKHNNNSISAITSMASLTTGAMTLIKEQTASSSASISFVDGSGGVVLDSTYPIYKFEFINIHPASSGVRFDVNFSTDSGSNYNVTKTTTLFNAQHAQNDSFSTLAYQAAEDLAQSTSDQMLANSLGNADDESSVGYLFLFAPSSTTFVKHFISRYQRYGLNSYSIESYIAGYGNTTSAIDGVRFKMSSGNIDAGTIKLYGIKDS